MGKSRQEIVDFFNGFLMLFGLIAILITSYFITGFLVWLFENMLETYLASWIIAISVVVFVFIPLIFFWTRFLSAFPKPKKIEVVINKEQIEVKEGHQLHKTIFPKKSILRLWPSDDGKKIKGLVITDKDNQTQAESVLFSRFPLIQDTDFVLDKIKTFWEME